MSLVVHRKLSNFVITRHAQKRMEVRHIPLEAVVLAVRAGRVVFCRGAKVFALGRKEIARLGGGLKDFDGIQVVTVGVTILTVYRNRDLRGLRRSTQGRRWQK